MRGPNKQDYPRAKKSAHKHLRGQAIFGHAPPTSPEVPVFALVTVSRLSRASVVNVSSGGAMSKALGYALLLSVWHGALCVTCVSAVTQAIVESSLVLSQARCSFFQSLYCRFYCLHSTQVHKRSQSIPLRVFLADKRHLIFNCNHVRQIVMRQW